MRIYLFIWWVAWYLWWSELFISSPLNIWGLQMVWDRATLLSLSNLNRVLKLNSACGWWVSLSARRMRVQPCQGLSRRAGRALGVVLHFWHRSVPGRSAEVFRACGDLSGSKGLSRCSGQLCPVVRSLKFSNRVWLAPAWQLVVLVAAAMLRSEREVGVSPALGEQGGLFWFS